MRFYIALIGVSVGAAGFAIAFRATVTFVFHHWYGQASVLEAFQELPIALRILLPAAGGLGAGAVSLIASRGRGGAGVSDVMEAVVLGDRPISLTNTGWRALGSWLAFTSGGSIGREGPLIQFGGALGSFVGQQFEITPLRRRALIGAGTAAGFAAAYNTPFAAVLFVTSVVVGVEALGVVMPAMIASVIATALTRAAVGEGPLYGEHVFQLVSQWELTLHLAVGAIGGVVAVAFMVTLRGSENLFRRLPIARPFSAASGGAIVGLIACWLPEVTGNGQEAALRILDSPVTMPFLGVLLIGKIVATASSVGSGSPGGVFTPSLVIGAATGALVHAIAATVAPSAHLGASGGYALVGMAAVVAATTHAPMMAAVLVFELTGDYAIALPLLVATSAATAVARFLLPESIYMHELAQRGLSWETTVDGRVVRSTPSNTRPDEP
jgi:CIC family chloride channel protein